MSGVVPQVAAMVGPGAAGTAYIPGLADFVPMVKGIGSLALGGPALVKAVDRAGDRRAGARRLEGPQRSERRRRRRVRGRRRVPRGRAAGTSRTSRRTATSRRPTSPCDDPVDRRDEALLDLLPEIDAQAVRHVQAAPRRRRPRRAPRHQAALRAQRHHLLRAHRRQERRHRRQPADAPRRHPRQRLGRQGGALHPDLRRLQRAARVPPGRAGLHGRLEGGARGHHPARRQDAPRHERGDGAQAHRRRAQGVRRGLLRDVRARVRAGPHRRLADGRDQRDGRRGHGRHRREEALRRRRAAARGEARASSR